MKKTYVVTGATGNTGNKVALELLNAGQTVIVIGRDEAKLKKLTDKGAIAAIGNVEDQQFLTTTFKNTDGVYLMIPPQLQNEDQRGYYNQISKTYLSAVKDSGIKNIVFLSSLGAGVVKTHSIIEGLSDAEKLFSSVSDVNILTLRPAFFMENLFWQIGTIKQHGVVGSANYADKKIAMVSTKDIAKAAADRLLKLDFSGHSLQHLLGPNDLSFNEATEILGKAINKPNLKYVAFPYSDAEQAMIQFGLSNDAAKRMVQLSKDMNEGISESEIKRNTNNTTSTSLEEFSKEFAAAFNA